MSRFLDSLDLAYSLHIVDTREPDFKNQAPNVSYTKADFFDLKADQYMSDAVINTDVLEHIPDKLKFKFINQCLEFGKSVVIFSAPQADALVTSVEEQINKQYEDHTGKPQRWLKEHFEFGKPDFRVIEDQIMSRKLPYISLDTNNVDNWYLSFMLNFINTEVQELYGVDEFNRWYNQNIHSVGDYSSKAYRKILVVFKDRVLYEKHCHEILEFFKPDDSDKVTVLAKALTLLTHNMAKLHSAISEATITINKLSIDRDSLALGHNELERELKAAQRAFMDAHNELETIKSGRTYRYITKVKKLKARQ